MRAAARRTRAASPSTSRARGRSSRIWLTAPEATCSTSSCTSRSPQLLIDHAKQAGEPEWIIAKVRRALRQPGDSARHDDHLHVRVYCAPTDRQYGCEDIGPLELLAEREAEQNRLIAAITSGVTGPRIDVPEPPAQPSLTELAESQSAPAAAAAASSGSLGADLEWRAGADVELAWSGPRSRRRRRSAQRARARSARSCARAWMASTSAAGADAPRLAPVTVAGVSAARASRPARDPARRRRDRGRSRRGSRRS